jgi:uncharacterized protein (TIGR03067 family)
MYRAVALCLGLLVPVALFAADPEPENDAKNLLGTWKIVKGTKGGEEPSEDMLKSKLIFTADKVTVTRPSGGEDPASYKIDPKKNPKEIDITPMMGADLVVRGIYKFEKGQLILHASKPGSERPKKFDDKSDVTLILEREKKKD